MSEAEKTEAPRKKGKGKLIVMLVGVLVLVGGGVAGGLYAARAGGGDHGAAAEHAGPKLVPKSEQQRVAADGKGHATTTSTGTGYASTYFAMEKDFTSNLRESVHFVQVGIAVSTPYDQTVIENLKTNEIAVRSAILMTLGDTTEEQVFTSDGKKQLQRRLVAAINATLKEKEGFGGIGNVYFTNFVVQ